MFSAKSLRRRTMRKRNRQVSKQLRFIKKLAKQAIKFGKDYCFVHDDLYDDTITILKGKEIDVTPFSADGCKGFVTSWKTIHEDSSSAILTR